MNLYIRLLILLITNLFKKPINDVLAGCSLNLRVLPNDLDLNVHMNNGRYLTIMDLGRMDLTLRLGLLKKMMQENCIPVLSSAKVRYRIPLMPFQRYSLKTRVICWDQKWVYMEQRFTIRDGKKAGATAAIGLVKGSFYDTKNNETVPSNQLLEAVGVTISSPPFPDYIQKWIEAEDGLKEQTASEVQKKAANQ